MNKLKLVHSYLQGEIGKEIDLFKAIEILRENGFNANYNELFSPGILCIKMQNMTFQISKNGKITVMGVKNIRRANENFNEIKHLLRGCCV